jgi:hypothetical protein
MSTQLNPTLDDIWALFRETDRKLQDNDRQLLGGLGHKFGSLTQG